MSSVHRDVNSGDLAYWLEDRLRKPLPGPTVNAKYGPRPALGRDYFRIPPDARHAAVLLLLYRHDDSWHLPLTLRPKHLPDHGGQISLPGGALEGEETPLEAALREFREELGDPTCRPRVLGRLTPIYIERSRFRVDPFLAMCSHRPNFCPDPHEVEEVLEVPLAHLVDPGNLESHVREYRGQTYEAPHFRFGCHRIWGATCLILGEFVTLVEEFLQEDRALRPQSSQ